MSVSELVQVGRVAGAHRAAGAAATELLETADAMVPGIRTATTDAVGATHVNTTIYERLPFMDVAAVTGPRGVDAARGSIAGLRTVVDETRTYAELTGDRTVDGLLKESRAMLDGLEHGLVAIDDAARGRIDGVRFRQATRPMYAALPPELQPGFTPDGADGMAQLLLDGVATRVAAARTIGATEARLDPLLLARSIRTDAAQRAAALDDGTLPGVLGGAREAARGAEELLSFARSEVEGLARNGVQARRDAYAIDPLRLEAATLGAGNAVAGARALLEGAAGRAETVGAVAVRTELQAAASATRALEEVLDGARDAAVAQVRDRGPAVVGTWGVASVPRSLLYPIVELAGGEVDTLAGGVARPRAQDVTRVRTGLRVRHEVDLEGAIGRGFAPPAAAVSAARTLIDESYLAGAARAPEALVADGALGAVHGRHGTTAQLREALAQLPPGAQ